MNLLEASITPQKSPACWDYPEVFANPSLYYDKADERFADLAESDHQTMADLRRDAEDAAVNVCMGCPLMFECEEAALAMAEQNKDIAGVVGGRTEAERKAITAARRGGTAPKAPTKVENPQIAPGDRGPRNQIDDEQVRIMTIQGRNAAYIAHELGCSERTVVRARDRLRKKAAQTVTAATAEATPAPTVAVTAPDVASAAKRLMVEEIDREITAKTTAKTTARRTASTHATRTACTGSTTTGRAVNAAQVSEPMRAIYDILLDGTWHTRTELVTAAMPHVPADEAVAWWTRKNQVTVDGAKVLNPRKANTPVAEQIRAGAWDKVYNMLSASQRKGKTTERGGENNDEYRLTAAALTSWAAITAERATLGAA